MLEQQTMMRNPALKQLEVFIGQWEMQASIAGQLLGRGWATFEWLAGGTFVVRHEVIDQAESLPVEMAAASPFPINAIIGLDDSTGQFSLLYSDARGACRVLQMSLNERVWMMWRDAPGFSQRFTGSFSDDGHVINGRWEKSADRSSWELDFDLAYQKL